MAISHTESDSHPDRAQFVQELYESTSSPGQLRSIAEIRRFLDDVEPVDPGVVHLADWRPRADEPYHDPDQVWAVCGVGRWDGPVGYKP